MIIKTTEANGHIIATANTDSIVLTGAKCIGYYYDD